MTLSDAPRPALQKTSRPGTAEPALDAEVVASTTDQWYNWDVSGHVRPQRQAGAAAVTLALYGTGSYTSAIAVFDSKEVSTAATRPQLVVTTLLAPTGLTATAASATQVSLAWSGPSDNETGFRVERSADGGANWAALATTAANATTYTDATAAAGTAYQYRVRATVSSPAVDSGPTNAASVTTGQTTTLTLPAAEDAHVRSGTYAGQTLGTAGELEVRLHTATGSNDWREAFLRFDLTGVAAADRITSAKVRLHGRLSAAGSVDVGLFVPDATPWTEAGVKWENRPFSGSTWVGHPDLAALETLSSTASGWYEFDVTDFLKQKKTAGAATADLSIKATNQVSTAHAIFASDEAATNRPALVVVSTTATATPPAAPSGLTAMRAAVAPESQVDLNWADNSSNETGFVVERATNDTFSQNLVALDAAANATAFSNTGLQANTTYYYRVRAVNGAGSSANSATATVTTAAATAVPTAPSGLVTTAVTATQIDVQWTDNSTNENLFDIQRATDASFGLNLAEFTTSANLNRHSSTSLAAGTTYYFRVRARNGVGASAWSSPVAVATTGTPVVPPVAPSTFVTVARVGPDVTEWEDRAVPPGTAAAHYVVRAVDGDAHSDWSGRAVARFREE